MALVKTPEQKVILCGEFGVGKSSIFRRYAFNTFVSSNNRKSTLGLDHFNKEYNVKGKSINVCIMSKCTIFGASLLFRVNGLLPHYFVFSFNFGILVEWKE